MINVTLMEHDCVAQHTIVACGLDGVDPHNQGSGPIRPHQSIVLDIFPRSGRTRYYADMTRTVVKGRASDPLRRMYDAVLAAQLRGIEMVRAGVEGQEIHAEVARTLERHGFETGLVGGRMQGFFHGTGHGLGLEVHEPPRVSKVAWVLHAWICRDHRTWTLLSRVGSRQDRGFGRGRGTPVPEPDPISEVS